MRGRLKQSRIGLALEASGMIRQSYDIEYIFSTWSDHAQIQLKLGDGTGKRGRGIWCHNNSLLEHTIYKN